MYNSYIEGLKFPLGHPFRDNAERLKDAFEKEAFVLDGVVRWRSNGMVPPEDVLEFWHYLRKPFDLKKSLKARDKDLDEFVRRYRENQRPPSDEQLAEMRNVFGRGTTVVDVISGRRIKL